MKKEQPLINLAKRYFEKDPVEAAHSLEAMSSQEAIEVLKNLPMPMAVEAIKNINDAYVAVLLQRIPKTLFISLVKALDNQQAANIFLQFPDDMRNQFLKLLDEKKRRGIQELLTFPADSAGKIMSVDFIAFHGGLKVREAVQKIRQLAQRAAKASYIYIIDQESHLVGVLRMRDLLLANDNDLLETIMHKDVYRVNCFQDREIVANELKQKNYFAAPVNVGNHPKATKNNHDGVGANFSDKLH